MSTTARSVAGGAGAGTQRKKKLGLALWGNEPIGMTVRHVELAEHIGLDSAWLVDTQLICREVYVTLAACAMKTSRIHLATGVTVPRTRHPSVMASAFATLNELSAGRMIVGLGTGNSALRTIGMPPATLAELEAYLAVLRPLLSNEPVRFDGGVEGKITWLTGPSRIPIYLAATGPKITRAAGRLADGVIMLQGVAPHLVSRALGLIEEGAREAGRSPETLDVVCWTYLGLASDPAVARDHVRGRVAAALKISNPDWFEGEDAEVVRRLQREYDYFKHASSNPAHAALVTDSLIDKYAIAGTPDEVRDRLKNLIAQPGFQHVVLSPQVSGQGSFPIDTVLRTLEKHVLPDL